KIVIDRILQEHAITGRHLLSFGDGYVEIENTKQAGGLADAVASDEAHNGSGKVDEWKRERLLGVGADADFPDFRDAIPFVDYLLGRGGFRRAPRADRSRQIEDPPARSATQLDKGR